MTRKEARRYMIQWQQKLKDGGFPIDSDRIQALRVAIEALKDKPTGKWIEEYNGNGWNDFWDYTCSNCGKKYVRADYLYHANYCPNCGAEMETEDE